MQPNRKIILYLWLSAGVILAALIIFARMDSSAPDSSAPAGTLGRAILGKWQADGYDEMGEYRADGSVVITGKNPVTLKYSFPNAESLQFTSSDNRAVTYSKVAIQGDELTMRNDYTGNTVKYRRVK